MKALLEIHVLQNFAPSNLNRDDTGSPKDAYFGGVKRGRVSSQSLKRAMRTYFKDQNLLDETNLAVRTKRLTEKLVGLLEVEKHPRELAVKVVNVALGGLRLSVEEDKNKTQYLLYFGNQEIEAIAKLIHTHWDSFEALVTSDDSGKKKDKKAAKNAIDKDIVAALEAVLNGGKAVDVALFGRMLADLPEKNQYAVCQVAHAISTHAIKYDEDFYTAVDDLKPDDNAGADMIGTVEFNSACYYRYIVIDLEQLHKNLQLDTELVEAGIKAFLQASIYALPTGKQNTFAAHQVPSFIGSSVRKNASARSLTNAFEKPVRTSDGGWLNASATALVKEWHELEEVFGQGGVHKLVNRTDASLKDTILEKASVKSVDIWITETLEQAMKALRS